MKSFAKRVIAAAFLLLALGACASGSGGATPTGGTTAAVASGPPSAQPCGAVLVLQYGPLVVPMTGEHAVMYKIRNRGRAACSLAGYPGVTLYDAKGNRLAFHYTDGRSLYVTKDRPRTVVLAPGGSAFVLVAKYRCDLGALASAATIKLTLPGHPPITLTGPVAAPRSGGVAGLDYCKGGPKDPGRTVGISPVEARPGAAGPFAM